MYSKLANALQEAVEMTKICFEKMDVTVWNVQKKFPWYNIAGKLAKRRWQTIWNVNY